MNELQLRVAATTATKERFEGRPFDWSKSATCIHLARYHAAKMGHKLPVVPRFGSALGARKALKAAGYDTLPDLLDGHFERIPPAFMRVGDLLALPGKDGWHALAIKGSRVKYLGWHEEAEGCAIVDVHNISEAAGAWRL